MKENILKTKSFSFSISIINLYKYLCDDKKEYVISKQLLRSGTSIGANICESEFSESKLDFIHKLSISQKEVNETIYWIELLYQTNYIEEEQFKQLQKQSLELMKLITASIKTAKQNI
ncbi:MAG: four helix bundle protein, partial [Bacteroidales bacterium]|nr:four helix bundle protein [Bacteroidales bacterium]